MRRLLRADGGRGRLSVAQPASREAPGPGRDPTTRELLAERIAARLDVPFTVGGVLFVLLLIADRGTPPESPFAVVWTAASWALWALFVLEFALRLVIAPSTGAFLRRNWWQVAFLAVPFLRFLRGLSRGARLARSLSTTVRGSRTAASRLTGRVGMLASATLAAVLGGTEVLVAARPELPYTQALHDVTLAAVSGEALGHPGGVAAWLEVVLALYATVFFSALAGSLGAYFLQRRDEEERATAAE